MTARPPSLARLPIDLLTAAAVLVAALALAAALCAAPASAATSEDYFFISSVGPAYSPTLSFAGSGAGPDGIATDAAGNIYVTLPTGFAKFNASGTHVVTYTGDNGYVAGASYGLDVDWRGNVYYADRSNHCIVKLHPSANGVNGTSYSWVSITGKNAGLGDANIGAGDGEFNFPSDVTVGGNYLYVADLLNHRVQKLYINPDTNQLVYDSQWGKVGGGSGTGDGEFNRPRSVDAQSGTSGHVFVVEELGRRVQEFTAAGAFVGKFGSTSAADPLFLSGPTGVDVDAAGDVIVTDLEVHAVAKYRKTDGVWARVTRFGSLGSADAQFHFPWASVVDPNGYLYVTDTFNNKLKRFARDATAPTVTPAGFPAGWVNTLRFCELISADPTVTGQYRSGVAGTWYSKTGDAPWTAYYEPLVSLDFVEGDNAITYYAKDAVGNESTPATVHLYYDKTAPVTTASGVPSWSKTDVAVELTPGDDGRSPVASTEYRAQGAPDWSTYVGAFSVSAEGASVYEFRSTDTAGNVETAKTVTVRIDRTRPVTKALADRSVRQKKTVKLPFTIIDVAGAQAKVTIKIFKGRTLKKTLSVGTKATNVSLSHSYRCRLAKGSYTWKVYATDLAGNAQARAGAKRLTVK